MDSVRWESKSLEKIIMKKKNFEQLVNEISAYCDEQISMTKKDFSNRFKEIRNDALEEAAGLVYVDSPSLAGRIRRLKSKESLRK
jgi:hypothetical protein